MKNIVETEKQTASAESVSRFEGLLIKLFWIYFNDSQ